MSATICWRPGEYGKSLGVWAPSRFIKMLEAAFGSLPILLDESALPTLKGMKVALAEDNDRAAIEELIAAIKDHTQIEVLAHY